MELELNDELLQYFTLAFTIVNTGNQMNQTLLAGLTRLRKRKRPSYNRGRRKVPRLLALPLVDPFERLSHSPGRFRQLFRLTIEEFQSLLEDVRPILQVHLAGCERRPSWLLLVLLQYLAHGNTYGELVAEWGGSESTLSRDFGAVIPALSDHLYEKHIKWLSDAEIHDVWDNFTGLEGGISVMDVVRLRISKPPAEIEKEYFATDKKFHCLKALVNCAWNGRILSVVLNESTKGRRSDLYILRNSEITADHAELFPVIGGVEAFALGDGAYEGSIDPIIHTPWKKNAIHYDEGFNKLIRRYRIVIENVFGRLLGQWRLFWMQRPWAMHRLSLLPPTFKLAAALTERLFSVRDAYPRSPDWVLGNPEPWETNPDVQNYVNNAGPFNYRVFIDEE